MDEPTSGLDPNQIRGVRQLIRDLGQSKTVLVSTHILQEVEPVADRVLFIHDGKIVFDGKPAETGQPERNPRAGVLQSHGPAGLKRSSTSMLRRAMLVQGGSSCSCSKVWTRSEGAHRALDHQVRRWRDAHPTRREDEPR